MPTFLQPVSIPERCFLFEVLLWVAFGRLPLAASDHEGTDIRESYENREKGVNGYGVKVIEEYIFDDECQRAGISPDPRWKVILEGAEYNSVAFYDRVLKKSDLHPAQRAEFISERKEALKLESAVKGWKVEYSRAVEYPASRIFIALRDGSLRAEGRLLPFRQVKKAVAQLTKDGLDIIDVEPSPILPSFWTLQGINFESSWAVSEKANYCHVTCSTREVLSIFPGERQDVRGVERVGDSFIVSDEQAPPAKPRRGRPPYPWAAFDAEVSRVLENNGLPEKKEAAIQFFQDWFQTRFGVRPSRAAVGEKLTPYYEERVRNGRQKVR